MSLRRFENVYGYWLETAHSEKEKNDQSDAHKHVQKGISRYGCDGK